MFNTFLITYGFLRKTSYDVHGVKPHVYDINDIRGGIKYFIVEV